MIPDYTTRESRERTARERLRIAAQARAPVEARWNLVRDYYEGHHHTQEEIAESCREAGIPWIAACSPDIYLHVESQIRSSLPDFSFRGRDSARDDERARAREYLVRYVTQQQELGAQVPMHERRCILCGTAVWKVYWDGRDVRVRSVDPRDVYPDPAASRPEDCEYISFVCRLPRGALTRLYGDELRERGIDPRTLEAEPDGTDTLSVTEHWYRGEAGEIACSVLAGGREIRHIPDYWRTTGCGRLPFVFQYRVAGDGLWGHSDMEPAIPLVDAVDRELAMAQLQSAFSGSDVILAEHDAFAQNPEQRPGAIWELRPGAIDKIRRLGGLADAGNRLAMIETLRGMIRDAVGNYDAQIDSESAHTLSATGLALMLERADLRRASKKAECLRAYAALFCLIDWTVLEFYDDDRVIRLGSPVEGECPRVLRFDRAGLRGQDGYLPEIDCTVTAADAMESSRAFTLQSLETLLAHSVTRENWPLILRALHTLELEDTRELERYYETLFDPSGTDGDHEKGECT